MFFYRLFYPGYAEAAMVNCSPMHVYLFAVLLDHYIMVRGVTDRPNGRAFESNCSTQEDKKKLQKVPAGTVPPSDE